MEQEPDINALIDGCRRGKKESQRALYLRYSARFYALCLRYLGDRSLAQDALSQGFIEVFVSVGGYRYEGPFEAWMRVIFVRQALRIIRDQMQHQFVEPAEADLHFRTESPEPQEGLREVLDHCLYALRPDWRTAFNLVAVEGYSYEEAADMLKTTPEGIRKRYQKATERLRTLLSRFGIEQ